jgi:hypothetical protein
MPHNDQRESQDSDPHDWRDERKCSSARTSAAPGAAWCFNKKEEMSRRGWSGAGIYLVGLPRQINRILSV